MSLIVMAWRSASCQTHWSVLYAHLISPSSINHSTHLIMFFFFLTLMTSDSSDFPPISTTTSQSGCLALPPLPNLQMMEVPRPRYPTFFSIPSKLSLDDFTSQTTVKYHLRVTHPTFLFQALKLPLPSSIYTTLPSSYMSARHFKLHQYLNNPLDFTQIC